LVAACPLASAAPEAKPTSSFPSWQLLSLVALSSPPAQMQILFTVQYFHLALGVELLLTPGFD
jgi:hypothetical protein